MSQSNREILALTVLLPVHNGMPFLPEAVEALLGQTYEEFELLVVDDGSSDGTAQFLATLTDPRIRVHRQDNRGLAGALNVGLELATHDWVARADADDVSLPTRLEAQVAFLQRHPDVGVVSCGSAFLSRSGRLIGGSAPTLAAPPYFDPDIDGNILHAGVVYDRRLVLAQGGYRELVPAEDLDLWLRLAGSTKLAVVAESLVHVRTLPSGLSSSAGILQHTMWNYVRASAEARRRGEPEPDKDEYLREQWPKGWRRAVEEASPRFRRAGAAWIDRRWLAAAGHMSVAFACNPRFVIQKLRSHL